VQSALLVIPLIISVTTFAFAPWTLNLAILVPTILLLLLPAQDHSPPPLPSHGVVQSTEYEKAQKNMSSVQPLPALSTWRAHMMLMTAICILAVDFPAYPRELAKCENFGTGLVREPLSSCLCHY
jgi:phosphatidylinositol glycan class W